MTDRKSVLVQIHVSQSDRAAPAATSSVKTVVGTPAATPKATTSGTVKVTAQRTWAVAFYGQKYLVLDAGAKGITIEHDGATVWSGRRLETGSYETRATTVPHDKLERLLRHVRVGDERTPKLPATPARNEQPPVVRKGEPRTPRRAATHPTASGKRPVSAAQAEVLARGRAVRAERLAADGAAKQPAGAAKPSARRGRKPPPPKPDCPPAKRRAPAKAPAHPPARPSVAKPTAEGTPHAPGAPVAKRKPGRPRKNPAGTATSAPKSTSKRADRAPATTRSVRTARVDDAAVLAEVKKNVKRDDPANATSLYAALERIWFAGGREATLAWMASHKIANVVDAYSDWVDKNADAARALLEKPATSKRGAAA